MISKLFLNNPIQVKFQIKWSALPLLLFLLLLISCSSQKLSGNELRKIALSVQTIPVKSIDDARNYLLEQKKYFDLLYSDKTQLPPHWIPSHCQNYPTGEIIQTKKELSLKFLTRVDSSGYVILCPRIEYYNVWEVFYMCQGDSQLTRLKIRQSHVPDAKAMLLCE